MAASPREPSMPVTLASTHSPARPFTSLRAPTCRASSPDPAVGSSHPDCAWRQAAPRAGPVRRPGGALRRPRGGRRRRSRDPNRSDRARSDLFRVPELHLAPTPGPIRFTRRRRRRATHKAPQRTC
jgi:hypothetical protein